MSNIRLACETYTWQMPGESYKGKLDHIMGIARKAGFEGIEPETSFFGDLSDPLKMKATLEATKPTNSHIVSTISLDSPLSPP